MAEEIANQLTITLQRVESNDGRSVKYIPVIKHSPSMLLARAVNKIDNKEQLLSLFQVLAYPNIANNDVQKSNAQKKDLYQLQRERTRQLYQATDAIRPTYLVKSLKDNFIEYQHYKMSKELDKRAICDIDGLELLWQQIHVVDDLIADIIHYMPAQMPAGWKIVSQSRNHLNLPTVGKLYLGEPIADQTSLNSYILSHFGVMSHHYDKGQFIGHVVGYLFCCYYFAQLSISYSVTPLESQPDIEYDYASLEVAKMVRLLQGLDVFCRKRIYQLAVIAARLSYYATDKRIEKMLIAEVNDFDKAEQEQYIDILLDKGLMLEDNETHEWHTKTSPNHQR